MGLESSILEEGEVRFTLDPTCGVSGVSPVTGQCGGSTDMKGYEGFGGPLQEALVFTGWASAGGAVWEVSKL